MLKIHVDLSLHKSLRNFITHILCIIYSRFHNVDSIFQESQNLYVALYLFHFTCPVQVTLIVLMPECYLVQ